MKTALPRRPAVLSIRADAITVEADGSVEALDAIQADAFEVRLPEPSEAEAREAGRILAAWVRQVLKVG